MVEVVLLAEKAVQVEAQMVQSGQPMLGKVVR